MGVDSARGKIMWKTSFLVVIWTLWKKKFQGVLKGLPPPSKSWLSRLNTPSLLGSLSFLIFEDTL